MDRDFCIFCKSPLNNSDEHIIPQSINGTLHSKYLICHQCNSEYFGQKIDPVIKHLLNPVLLMLGWDNASAIRAEDIKGGEYTVGKELKVRPIKPEKTIAVKGSQTHLKVSGDVKNTLRLFEKEAKKLKDAGKVLMKAGINEVKNSTPFILAKWTIEPSLELNLLMNKIALEYYSLQGLDHSVIENLCKRVRSYDSSLDNVRYCNYQNEIRELQGDEISHLIYLNSDVESKILYCYIELFNLICCVVILADNYEGETISIAYHQDAITGERFNTEILLKKPIREILSYEVNSDGFQYLNNALVDQIRSRDFSKIFNEELTNIVNTLKKQVEEGKLSETDFESVYVEEAAALYAELTVYAFPYIISDQDDEENDDYNYVQSNFKTDIVDDFIKEHDTLLGKRLKAKDGTWLIESFHKQPVIVKKNKPLITLYVKLIEENSGEEKFIKVKEIINLIVQSLEAMNNQQSNDQAASS